MPRRKRYDATLRARVPKDVEDFFIAEAERRSLDVADIAREAFLEFWKLRTGKFGAVFEDQAPYGGPKPGTPPAQFAARPPLAAESPAVQALEAGLPEVLAAVEARARADAAKAPQR